MVQEALRLTWWLRCWLCCSSLVVVDGKIGVGGIVDREEDEEEIPQSIIE